MREVWYHLEVGGDDFYIDLLLCRSKNETTVEYTLRGTLPTIGELESALEHGDSDA